MLRNIIAMTMLSASLTMTGVLADEGLPKQAIAPTDVGFRGRTIIGGNGYARFKMIAVGEQIQIITDQGTATFIVVEVKKNDDNLLKVTVEPADNSDRGLIALNNVTVGSPVSIVIDRKIVAQTSVAGINAIASGDYIVQSGPYRIVVVMRQRK